MVLLQRIQANLASRLVQGAFGLALCGCASRTIPCAGAVGCPLGHECLANRCASAETAPVREKTRRLVVSPVALAVASERPVQDLAASVRLGSAEGGPVALYVRFDAKAHGDAIEAAFLLLDPESHSIWSEDVDLEVGRAERAWDATALSWSEEPEFALPAARAIARSAPPSPIRIDVTELVRFTATNPGSDFGFIVRARKQRGHGVSVATGMDGGRAPRLDIYLTK